MEIDEFLLARIAEDEDKARAPLSDNWWQSIHPDRVLAECDSKRRIVSRCEPLDPSLFAGDVTGWNRERSMMLWLLSLPYADHPDYREDWRP